MSWQPDLPKNSIHGCGCRRRADYRTLRFLADGWRLEHLELIALEAELTGWHVDRDFVVSAPARRARVVRRDRLQTRKHPLQRQVSEAVDLEKLGDLLDGAVVRDQLVGRREVDPVKAGMTDRRAADAQVDLLRARATQRPHLRSRRRPAHDRI